MDSSTTKTTTFPSTQISPAEVLSWLKLLNSPDLDFEPVATYPEPPRLRSFRAKEPTFSTAAASWPSYANKYWSTIQHEAYQLFDSSSKSHNFSQWVLEYARQTLPKTFKLAYGLPLALERLAKDLAAGLVTPMHMAAILGIPGLVQLLPPEQLHLSGVLGPPIYCALAGPSVLKAGTNLDNWGDVFNANFNSSRAHAIHLILNLESSHCRMAYHIQNPMEWVPWFKVTFPVTSKEASLFGLAFWASASSNDSAILYKVASQGAEFDAHALFVICNQARRSLRHPITHQQSISNALRTLASWVVNAYKETLNPFDFFKDSCAQELFMDLLEMFAVRLPWPAVSSAIRYDEPFARVLGDSIREGLIFELDRLKLDPQFDLRMEIPCDSDQYESICHTAVSANHLRFVDFLLKSGADFTVVDEKGRTPLMVVESTEMLHLLHKKHGIPITATDYEGRSLWHLACYSHDIPIVSWLCQHDKDRKQNMQVRDDSGRTPFDAALEQSRSAPTLSSLKDAVLPRTIVKAIRECQLTFLSSPFVNSAVEWGSAELVNEMRALGSRFDETDDQQNTTVHCLNAMATPELAKFLVSCQRTQYANPNSVGFTPAEAVIHNLLVSRQVGAASLNSHCDRAELSVEAFTEILKGESVAPFGSQGFELWEAVCKRITEDYRVTREQGAEAHQPLLDASLQNALQALIDLEFHTNYEMKTNRPAFITFEVGIMGKGQWSFVSRPWFLTALRCCQEHTLQNFCQTRSARVLLGRAFIEAQWDAVVLLIQNGMLLDDMMHSADASISLVKQFLLDSNPTSLRNLRAMLGTPVREHFLTFVNKSAIFTSLVYPGHAERDLCLQKLFFLLQAGLSPNPSLQGGQPVFPLIMALSPRPSIHTIRLLLHHGADPTLGPGALNAFLLAASMRSMRLSSDLLAMQILIEYLERRKTPFNWECAYLDPVHNRTFNALQAAAFSGNERMLKLLLLQQPLRKLINSPSSHNRSTPAHVAAAHGWIGCLEILADYGADLSLLDSDGRTPHEVAYRNRHHSACQLIRASGGMESSTVPLTSNRFQD